MELFKRIRHRSPFDRMQIEFKIRKDENKTMEEFVIFSILRTKSDCLFMICLFYMFFVVLFLLNAKRKCKSDCDYCRVSFSSFFFFFQSYN